jgi:glycosyltransferase involved in cell wall biosynthesis
MIGVSDFVRRRLIEADRVPAARVARIYNGVDLARFTPGPPDEALLAEAGIACPPRGDLNSGAARRIVVSTIAHLRREKGIHDLVDAIALLAGRFPEIQLLIAGEGPERAALATLARERGISSRVHFLGLRSDVDRVLRASDITVFPSTWQEAFGLVLVEAMGCGKPIVSTRVGGIPEVVVDGETGFLVEPGDAAGLASRIGLLCEDAEVRARLGGMARRAAVQKFGIDRMVDDVVALYDGVRGRGH